MLCRVFCNLADRSSVKTNQEVMMFTAENKTTRNESKKKLTLSEGHVSSYHELNLSCHELLVVFGFSTPNSNRTNHKLRKKLANQKQRHMSLRLCGIRTRYCALIRRRSIQGLECLRRRQRNAKVVKTVSPPPCLKKEEDKIK